MKFDYFFYKNLYSSEECKLIRNLAEKNIDPAVIDQKADGVKKTVSVGAVQLGGLKPYIDRFNQMIISINRNNFGFSVFETCDLEYLNYNVYESNKQSTYEWHSDNVKGQPYDLKLTAILNLGDEKYDGGDFQLFLNEPQTVDEIRLTGSILVFPSFLQHRVTPVTAGNRITLTRWVNGSNFK